MQQQQQSPQAGEVLLPNVSFTPSRQVARGIFPANSRESHSRNNLSGVNSSGNKSNVKQQGGNLSLPFIIQDGIGSLSTGIRWKRAEVLGQGAFGVVYLGLNIDSGELMAVKHMNYSLENMSRKELASLENEINILRSFRHPNIVRYIGTELSEDNTLCIFLEYIPGGSVKTLIDKFGPLNENVVRSYVRQLLLGLEYLHRNGIAHRDIKGANCLVGNDGVVKLSDFGASKFYWRRPKVTIPNNAASTADPDNIALGSSSAFDEGSSSTGRTSEGSLTSFSHNHNGEQSMAPTSNENGDDSSASQSRLGGEAAHRQENKDNDHVSGGGDVKGTPCWMAPEVIKIDQGLAAPPTAGGPAGDVNWRKADIWSLACTCIEMSTGRAPWSQFNNPVTILFHLACTETVPDYPSEDISMEYTSFLSACLQRDTLLRPDVTSLLLHPFVTAYPGGWSNTAGAAGMMRPTTVSGTPAVGNMSAATDFFDSSSASVNRNSRQWSRSGTYNGGSGSSSSSSSMVNGSISSPVPHLGSTGGNGNGSMRNLLHTRGTTGSAMIPIQSIGTIDEDLHAGSAAADACASSSFGSAGGSLGRNLGDDQCWNSAGDQNPDSNAGTHQRHRNQFNDSPTSSVSSVSSSSQTNPDRLAGSIPITPLTLPLEPVAIRPLQMQGENLVQNECAQQISSVRGGLTLQSIGKADAVLQGGNEFPVLFDGNEQHSEENALNEGAHCGFSDDSCLEMEDNANTSHKLLERADVGAAQRGNDFNENEYLKERNRRIMDNLRIRQQQQLEELQLQLESELQLRPVKHHNSIAESKGKVLHGIGQNSLQTSLPGSLEEEPSNVHSTRKIASKQQDSHVSQQMQQQNLQYSRVIDAPGLVAPAPLSPVGSNNPKRFHRNIDKGTDGLNGGGLSGTTLSAAGSPAIGQSGLGGSLKTNNGIRQQMHGKANQHVGGVSGSSNVNMAPPAITGQSISINAANVAGFSLDSAISIVSWGKDGVQNSVGESPVDLSVPGTSMLSSNSTRQLPINNGKSAGNSGVKQRGLAYKGNSMTPGGVGLDRRGVKTNTAGTAGFNESDASGQISSAGITAVGVNSGFQQQQQMQQQRLFSQNASLDKSGLLSGDGRNRENAVESDCGHDGEMPGSGLNADLPLSDSAAPSEFDPSVTSDLASTKSVSFAAVHCGQQETNITPVALVGHVGSVTKLRAPSKVDGALLSCGFDGTVRLWNCLTGQQAMVLTNSDSSGESNSNSAKGISASKLTALYANDMCSEIWAGSSGHGGKGSDDLSGTVYFWSGIDNGTGKAVRKFNGSGGDGLANSGNNGITCMEGLEPSGLSMHDSSVVATGSNDKSIRLWDSRARKPLVRVLKGHSDGVLCMQWLSGERSLISGSKDKTLRIWDIRTGRTRFVLDKHFGAVTAIERLPVEAVHTASVGWGRVGNTSGGAHFASGGRDGMVHVWSSDTGDCVQTTAAHRGTVAALSNFGTEPGQKSTSMYSTGSDGIIKVWDCAGSGGSVRASASSLPLDATLSRPVPCMTCTAEIDVGYNCRAAFSPLHSGLFTAAVQSVVGGAHLWRLDSGNTVATAPSVGGQQVPDELRTPKTKHSLSSPLAPQVNPPSPKKQMFKFQQVPVSVGAAAGNSRNRAQGPTGLAISGSASSAVNKLDTWVSQELPSANSWASAEAEDSDGDVTAASGCSTSGCTDMINVSCSISNTCYVGIAYKSGAIQLYH